MMVIRPVEPKDIEPLITLGELAVQETRYHSQSYDPSKIRRQAEVYFRDERRKYICLVGLRDDQVLGLLFGNIEEYWFTKDRCANMIIWYVAQEARGSAMSVKLLLAFRRWAENSC